VTEHELNGAGGTAAGPVVGVIGLGAIGDGVATNVTRCGLPLVVCDVRPEATERHQETAVVADSPADLARQSDVVVVAVLDDDQVYAVLSGPGGGLAAAARGTPVIIVSTISVACVEAIGSEADGLGIPVLDCGVSGGPSAAAAGELVCMVGGDPEVIEQVRPVFDAIGSLTVAMGPFGTGLAAKLARNLVQYGSWLAAYEGQVLAEAAGIDLADLATVIRASDTRIGGASTLMFRTTVAPFTDSDDRAIVGAMESAAQLAHKDLSAALELARSLEVSLPLATMTDERRNQIFGLGDSAG
jgi:3-hydroxyisobutyrate dehydrogenase